MRKLIFLMFVLTVQHIEASSLKAIVLVEHKKELLEKSELKQLDGIYTRLPEADGLYSQLVSYLGKELDRPMIQEIQNRIMRFYQKKGMPFFIVQVPSQEITSGVLQLVVVESRVNAVKVEGDSRTRKQLLEKYMKTEPGNSIRENKIAQDLDFMNRNPFRSVSLVYSPGESERTTDLTFVSQDRKPWLIYTGAQNNGVVSTGRQRWFTGVTWGYFFNLDHIFSFQYTTSNDFNEFQAYTAQYMALLSWRHILNIYGGYSTVKLSSKSPFRTHGMNAQASFRYTIPLPVTRHLLHDFTWGFDYKRLNNTLAFTEGPSFFGKNVNVTQLLLGYKGSYSRDTFALDFQAEVFWSPGRWLSDQSNADFASLQPGATNHWVYGRAFFSYLQTLPRDFSIYLSAQGEVSNENLLPTEEMGLGGYDTVRGYNERELNRDNVYLLNFEIRTPPIKGFSQKTKKVKDHFQFLAFFDYGGGAFHRDTFIDDRNFNYLMGAGPGLRYRMEPGIDLRIDWGIRLHTAKDVQGSGSFLHFSAIANY